MAVKKMDLRKQQRRELLFNEVRLKRNQFRLIKRELGNQYRQGKGCHVYQPVFGQRKGNGNYKKRVGVLMDMPLDNVKSRGEIGNLYYYMYT